MIEQDYIVRLIKEMIRMLLKLLFHIDTESPTAELLNETEARETLDKLFDMADNGSINEAENKISELTLGGDMKNLEMALLFYSYLNDKTDDFLEKNDFSRKEIGEGLRNLLARYGLSGLAELFLMEF